METYTNRQGSRAGVCHHRHHWRGSSRGDHLQDLPLLRVCRHPRLVQGRVEPEGVPHLWYVPDLSGLGFRVTSLVTP